MNLKRLSALAVVTLAATLLTACASTPDSSPEASGSNEGTTSTFPAGSTMERISQAGTMTAAVKFDTPGFGLTGLSDTPKGFDVEITKLIAAKLGVKPDDIEYIEGLANLREEVLERNEVDMVIATYTMNEERAKRVSFAGPYYMAGQQIMVSADNSTITGPDSLKSNPDQKVCTNTGSTPAQNIQPYLADPSQLVLFDVVSKCADALRTGQVQAVTDDNTNLLGLVSESDGKFKLVGDKFSEEPYGIGISKGDVEFCKFIDETLTEAVKSGEYEKAWKATGGQVEGSTTPTLPELAPCS